MPLVAAAVALLALSAFGGYYVLTRDAEPAQAATRVASAAPAKQSAPAPTPPQVVAAVPAAETSTAPMSTALDVEERQRRIDEEVQRRVQMEMMKLQAEYDRDLQRERDRVQAQNRPESRVSTPAAEPRRETTRDPGPGTRERASETFRSTPADEPTRVATLQPQTTTTTSAPPSVVPAPVTSTPAPQQATAQTAAPAAGVPQSQQATLLEGDLVGYDQLDAKPQPRTPLRPTYPPVAARQKLVASVFLTALISETGQVLDVKVLRGDARRVGFDEAAVRAVRNTSFTPPMKDGKRVRTWVPIPIRFEP